MQIQVLVVTLVLMAVVTLAFVASVRASGIAETSTNVESRRMTLIWSMVVVGVIVTFASLWQWPHAISDSGQEVTINATGSQWSWEIDKEEVSSGKTVVFNVHTTDVTHGLGLVDPSGRLLFQTQAMPGYVNKVQHVLETPGTYQVICLEFCGIAHHVMTSEFEVVTQ